jgi:2'-5' RNA ligase
MPFAVELYFDQKSETTVRQVWNAIADAGFNSSMIDTGSRPHVSLGGCKQPDVTGLAQGLAPLASGTPSFALTLSSIGFFPTTEGVVFLGVTVTQHLLDIHFAFHRIFQQYAQDPSGYYQVGRWVPHCTLAFGVTSDRIADIVAISQHTSLPIHAQVKEIGIVDVSPTHCAFIYTATLGG